MTDAYGVNPNWIDAGFVDAESGLIDRQVAMGEWSVPPTVELEGDSLVWSPLRGNVIVVQFCRSSPGLLGEFIALVNAGDVAIRDFARKWGVLEVCEHGLPGEEPVLWMSDHRRCRPSRCAPVLRTPGEANVYREPLAAWRLLSRQAGSMLNLAASLYSGQLGTPEDMTQVLDALGERFRGLPSDTALAGFRLSEAINAWLVLGGVRPVVAWGGYECRSGTVMLGGGGLFGALAVQLLMQVSRSDGLAICSACGTAYTPLSRAGRPRRPAAGRRRYCQSCRHAGASKRDASAAYRNRRREWLPTPISTPKPMDDGG